MDYSNFQDWEIDTLAKRNGQTAEEWKAEQDALAGKQTVPEAATPPTEPEKKNGTAAGDSSSADTSLESSETDPPKKQKLEKKYLKFKPWKPWKTRYREGKAVFQEGQAEHKPSGFMYAVDSEGNYGILPNGKINPAFNGTTAEFVQGDYDKNGNFILTGTIESREKLTADGETYAIKSEYIDIPYGLNAFNYVKKFGAGEEGPFKRTGDGYTLSKVAFYNYIAGRRRPGLFAGKVTTDFEKFASFLQGDIKGEWIQSMMLDEVEVVETRKGGLLANQLNERLSAITPESTIDDAIINWMNLTWDQQTVHQDESTSTGYRKYYYPEIPVEIREKYPAFHHTMYEPNGLMVGFRPNEKIGSHEAMEVAMGKEQYEILIEIAENAGRDPRISFQGPTVSRQEIMDWANAVDIEDETERARVKKERYARIEQGFIDQAQLDQRKKETDLFMGDLTEEQRKGMLFFMPGSDVYNKRLQELNRSMDTDGNGLADPDLVLLLSAQKDGYKDQGSDLQNKLVVEDYLEKLTGRKDPKKGWKYGPIEDQFEDQDLVLPKIVVEEMAADLEKSAEIIENEYIQITEARAQIDIDQAKIEELVQEFEKINQQIEGIERPVEILIRPNTKYGTSERFVQNQYFAEKYNSDVQAYLDKVNPLSERQEKIIEAFEQAKTHLNENIKEYSKLGLDYRNRLNTLTADMDQFQIADAIVGSVAKNWSNWDRLILSIEDFIVGSLASLSYLGLEGAQWFTDENSDTYKFIQGAKDHTVNYLDYLETRRQNLPYTGSIADGDIESWSNYLLANGIEAAPSIAAVLGPQGIATGIARKGATKLARAGATTLTKSEIAAGRQLLQNQLNKKVRNFTTGIFFTVGAGGEARKLTDIQLNAAEYLQDLNAQYNATQNLTTKAKLKKEIDYVERVANLPLWAKGLLVIGHGAVEGVSERLGSTRALQNFSKYNSALGYKNFRQYFNPTASKYLASTAGKFKGAGTGFAIEFGEEVFVQSFGNGFDIMLGKDISLFEGIDLDFAFNVGLAQMGMQMPSRAMGLYGTFKDATFNAAQRSEHRQISTKYFELQAEIEGLSELPQTEEIQEEIRTKQLKQRDLLDNALALGISATNNVAGLDKTDLKLLFSLEGELRYLQNQAAQLAESGKISDREALNDIVEQVEKIGEQREALLTKVEGKSLEEIEIAHKAAGKQAGNLTEAIALKKVFDYNNALITAAMGENAFIIDSKDRKLTPEAEQMLKDRGVSEAKIQVIKNDLAEGNNGAFYSDGTVFVFKENATKNMVLGGIEATRAANSPIHEIGHKKMVELGIITKEDGEEIIRVGDDLVNEILEKIEEAKASGKMTEQDAKDIEAIIEGYKADNNGQHDVDELVQLVVDLKAGDYISDSSIRQMWQVKSFINSVYNKIYGENANFYQLKNYKDVLNFIDTWQNSALFDKPVDVAEEESLEGKSSKSLLGDINALVPETVETQEQFFSREVFNPIYNDGNLHPAISNYIRSRSTSAEEANKIIESVADRLVNFNPAATRKSGDAKITFGEFLFSNVNFGKLDARKALFEEGQERAITESTDSEQARQIVSSETTTQTQAEVPTYKNLIRRRVLSPEALDNVRNKVKSTVRVMKTRMDQAVSKNVTVKPYIAEIKKAMGKQADIDLKKEMGGLKDGQLRKWLLKHKAAILENMTTTWMMTAMPNAVQKSVDGVYTSDWKGKKIDRESVSTDNAGRTSGAEMVRRLPKAATRLSDADFLSNFFNEDGSLIRGRKESLAKAMAEEISFDIINEAMQDPNSEIRQALETRQDLLGAELAENIVQQVVVDIERGNVKYSKALARLSNQNSGLLDQFNKITTSEEFKTIVRMYADDRALMSKSLVAYFKENPNQLEDLGITLNDARIIGKEINKNFAAQIKETNKIAKETAALSIRTELADHLSDLMFNVNEQIFSQDVESIVAKAGGEMPDVAKYGGRVRAMQSLNSINKGRAAVKYLAEKLGDKIFYLKGGLASPARLGGYVHSKGASTFDGLHIKDGEVKESGRSIRFGLFLSSADFDKSLGLNAANSPNTSSLNTTKGFIQGRKWDNATPEQRKALANAEYRQAEELKEVLVETIEALKEGYESGELSAEQVVIVISTIFSDAAMNSLGKASAGLRWFAVNKNGDLATMQDMVNEGIAYKPGEQRLLGDKKTPKDPFVLEHTIPNRSMALRSLDLIFNNKGEQELLAELENYNTAIIPQKVDDQVALNGFKDSMPVNHKPGDLPLITRYKGTGLEFYDAKTGQIVSTGIQHNVNELNDAIEAMEPGAKYSKAVPRAVFMVGGPGAGKTNVGKGLKLGRRGYKVVNQDLALEPMKEEAGLPANEQQYDKEQRSMRAKLGAAARKAADAKMQKYKDNRESMVVDGTGASYNATMKKINALREAGYEVSIVFANTSKEEAIARNKARAERALPDMIVERTWDAVQESAKLYKQEFGNKFYELNTNELKMGENLPQEFLDKLYKDLDAPAAKYSKALNREFNDMLERTTGVKSVKQFSRIQAQMRGRNKGRFKLFIAPGADDFRGLVHYAFAGKGKQGEADMAFLEEKLMIPYFKGVAAIDAMRQQIKRDFKVVTKQFKEEYKLLKKKIGNGMFTYDHALRVYMWDRQGLAVEGLSKRDKKSLLDAIKKNPELVALADALLVVSRRNEWPDPVAHWEGGSILSDLNSMTEKIGRKKFLEEFIENAEVIFSEENLNKIEAIFGTRHREALEDSLYAMKNGTNRPTGANRQVNAWLNWINGSTGAIMFFNRRSALLQMLSFTNFINWSDNNMLKAAGAFANQKQYWSDWTMIFNSDKLKERRGGLKQDVSESEIAAAAKGSKNSPQAILSYLLKIGFTPTQIADSMAIATGGAMFYRNRVNTYLKQGMDQKAAEEQAFLDFSMKSDEAQQSSDPALVSQQQRSVLGRLILAFANTPMQYTRLMKKAGQDLINGRGRPIENISKIAYYGVIQNFIFSALQSAMFSMFFDDDDDELTEEEREKLNKKEEQKTVRVINSMLDTVLRGSGVYGAVASTMKNAIMEYYKQEEKGFMGDHTYTLLAAAGISPPIQSKMRKIYSAIQTSKFERDNVEQRGWALTADGKLNLGPNWSIFGNVLSGVTNVPLDRVVDELKSVSEALDERNKAWQRIALALGWKTWDVGARNEEADLIKQEAKEARKQEGIRKAKETRRKNAEAKKKKEAEEAKAAFEEWEKEFIRKQRKNQEN